MFFFMMAFFFEILSLFLNYYYFYLGLSGFPRLLSAMSAGHSLSNRTRKVLFKMSCGREGRTRLSGRQNTTTRCRPCEKSTYQATRNGEKICRRCGRQYKSNRKLLKNCTRFHNQEYGDCYKGFYLNGNLHACQKCTSCPPGYGVRKECTKSSNTECEEEKCEMVSQ